MKKGLMVGALSSVVFLSGCSFPWEKENGAIPAEKAAEKVQENPEQLFFDFAKASGKKGLKNLGLETLDRDIFVKEKGNVTIDGDFDMEGVPMVNGGTGTFAIGINEEADFSDKKNPLLSEKVSVDVNALGGLVKVDAKGELKIVNNSVFAGISKLDTNFPGLTSEITAVIQKFVGQWYGNTFTEVEALVGDEGFDVQKMLTGGVDPLFQSLDLVEDIAKNPSAYVTFNSFVKEEGGYYFFEVTPKKETYEKIAQIGKEYFSNVGVLAELEKEGIDIDEKIKEAIEKIGTESVMLAYTSENPEYFKISKVIDKDGTEFVAENTKDGMKVLIQKTTGDDAGEITFTKNAKGDFSLVVDIPTEFEGKKTELLSGASTEDTFTLAVTAPVLDRELGEKVWKNVLNASFTKSGGVWGGEITTPEFTEGKLLVSKASFAMHNSKVTLSAVYNEKVITNVTLTASTEKVDSVNITVPENVKPFTDIQSDVEKEMNALYGVDDNQLQAEDSQAIAEIVEAGEVMQTPVPAQDVNDMNNVMNGEDDAQGGADYSEITPKLARMAELMEENPTGDAAVEFNALKAEVDAYATANDVNTETLKELLMKEIVKQSK